ILAVTDYGIVFQSLDSGMSWAPMDSNGWDSELNSTTTSPPYEYVNAIDTCGPYLFIGTQDYGILRSSDRGASWQTCGKGPPTSVWSLLSWNHIIFCGGLIHGMFYSYD